MKNELDRPRWYSLKYEILTYLTVVRVLSVKIAPADLGQRVTNIKAFFFKKKV